MALASVLMILGEVRLEKFGWLLNHL